MDSSLSTYRRRRISLSSGEISFVDEGAGPTIVLLHGAPFTSLGYTRLIAGLRNAYRVIAPDLPGFGASTASAAFSGDLEAYANFVAEFRQALELEDFYLFLFDSAGCIGLRAAQAFVSKLAGLVVADTVAFPLTGRAWPVRFVLRYLLSAPLARTLNRKLNLLPWLVATVVPLLGRRPFGGEERRAMLRQFDTGEKRDRIIRVFAQMGWNERFMLEVAEGTKLRLGHVPALLLFGQFDPVRFVGAVSRFREMFLLCRVRVIPWEEHFPIFASGEKVAQTVHAWITERRGKARRMIDSPVADVGLLRRPGTETN